ncbi:MAG: helical backbone metal receptor [Bryobacteraceae bacterium]
MSVLLLCALSLCAEPRRIISTAPGITEILFALGLGGRVVGVTNYCVYPPEVSKIAKIGTWMTPNLEAILSSRPDLVIVQRTAIHDGDKFRALKLPTVDVQLVGVEDIYATIAKIGAATGVEVRAASLIKQIRGDLDSIRQRVAGKTPAQTLFIVGRNPGTLEGIIAGGGKSYHSQVIEIAGGRNILLDSKVPYPKVLQEEILARNPDVIIDMGEHAEASGISEQQQKKEIELWRKRYPELHASRSGRIHVVSSSIYVVPGPRVVDLARDLARKFHPELFR